MAVFTAVDKLSFQEFAEAFGLSPPFELIPIIEGIENTNYRVVTDHGQFVLTLIEGRTKGIDIARHARLQRHLASHKLPVPQPLKNNKGLYTAILAGRDALLVTFLEGTSPTQFDEKQTRAAGTALADSHLAAANFDTPIENRMGQPFWRPYFKSIRPKSLEAFPGIEEEIAAELDFLDSAWPTELHQGIIHADFFPENVLFQDNQVTGILDFYYAATDFLAYDLAIALTAWAGTSEIWPDRKLIQSFLRGYNDHRTIPSAELEALPLLLRGACIRFLLTRLHDWLEPKKNAIVVRKDPMEYIAKLRTAQKTGEFFL